MMSCIYSGIEHPAARQSLDLGVSWSNAVVYSKVEQYLVRPFCVLYHRVDLIVCLLPLLAPRRALANFVSHLRVTEGAIS